MMMLPKEVSKKYKLVNWKGGHRQWFGQQFGWVDIENMTIKHADRLYQLGFSKLKLKPQRKPKEEDTEPETEIVKAAVEPKKEEDCGCGKKK
jgi:hypothetical protein